MARRYEIGARGFFGLKPAYGIPDHLADGPCVIDLQPGDRLVWRPPNHELSASEIELVEASGAPLHGVILTRGTVSGRDLDALVRLAMKLEHLELGSVKIDPPDALAATPLRTLLLISSWISAIPTTAEEVHVLHPREDVARWIPMLEVLPHLRLVAFHVQRDGARASALLQLPTPRLELPMTPDDVLFALFESAPIAPRAPLVVRLGPRAPEVYARLERAIAGTGITLFRGPARPHSSTRLTDT